MISIEYHHAQADGLELCQEFEPIKLKGIVKNCACLCRWRNKRKPD
jgi:hypothetical protein